MRKKDKEITDTKQIEGIIQKSTICRLAMSENDLPYIVPLCFGYKDRTLYFHSANIGKKLDILKNNPNVCFEFEIDTCVEKNEEICSWGMKYRSVIGFGKASFIDEPIEKQNALDTIIQQYTDTTFEFTEKSLKSISVYKVDISSMTGKQAQ